jgi:tetratricopeptide (TPR) repeat protein
MLPDPPPETTRIGLEAERLLYAGDFANAVRLADEAIAKSLNCDMTWMKLIVAHARMFLGHAAESRAYYLSFRSSKSVGWTSWETIILQDFEKLKLAGHSHWLMTEIEQHLKNEGWTTKGGPAHKSKGPTVAAADREFMTMNPNSLKTGGLLEQEGEIDKAAELYRRFLKKARAKAAAGARDVPPADSEHAMQRLAGIAHQHLMVGHFGQALELSRELLSSEPDRLPARSIEAQVLMLTGAGLEARAIFLKHRGQKVGADTWEEMILRDFEQHRKAWRSHALMDEISVLFGKPANSVARSEAPSPICVVGDTDLREASDIQSGDRLFEKGRRYLDGWDRKRAMTPNRINTTEIAHRDIAVERICDIAVFFIQNREFKEASKLADRALVSKKQSPRANIVKAHTLMFLGQTDEARTLYNKCSQERLDADRYGAETILSDFATLRDANLSSPLMDEIAAALTAPQTA